MTLPELTLLRLCLALLIPPPKLNVWQWGESRRWLRRDVTGKAGPYRLTTAPYQREPQESFLDRTVQTTVLQWAKRLGKTEIINNLHGFVIEMRACNILVGYPIIDSAKKWSRQFFVPMVRSTKALRDLISLKQSRDVTNTILVKEYPGGCISAVGANSPSAFRQIQAPIITLDEIDAMLDGDEGDPVELALGRAENYADCIQVLSSTPTLRGESSIESWMERSDFRKWFVKCRCGGSFVLEFEHLEWPKDEPDKALLRCPLCKAALSDDDRVAMVKAGEWRATQTFNGIRGYWLNGMNTLFPPKKGFDNKLQQFASDFLRAKRKRESLMVWHNQFLTLTWEDDYEAISEKPLLARREQYGPELPAGVILLVCAVDTQGNRLDLEVVGFGLEDETWGIEKAQIFGNPHEPFVWQQLDTFLAKTYQHPGGARLRVVITGIDSGGVVNNFAFAVPVYKYVQRHTQQASRGRGGFIAIKGSSLRGAPLAIERLQKSGLNLLFVGTDLAKSTVYDRLKITSPGPGYMHYPRPFNKRVGNELVKVDAGYGEEYFIGLTSERIRQGPNGREWVKKTSAVRNEPLDERGYALALFDLLNPDMRALAAQLSIPSELATQKQKAVRRRIRPRGFVR